MHWPGEKQQRTNGWIMLAGGATLLIAGAATVARSDMTWGLLLIITGLCTLSNALWHLGVLGPDAHTGDKG